MKKKEQVNFFDFLGGQKGEGLSPKKFTPPAKGDPKSVEMQISALVKVVAGAEAEAGKLYKERVDLNSKKGVAAEELAAASDKLAKARKDAEEARNSLRSFLAQDSRLGNDKPHLHKLILNHFSTTAKPRGGREELPLTVFKIVTSAIMGLPPARRSQILDFHNRLVKGDELFAVAVKVATASKYEFGDEPYFLTEVTRHLMAHLMRLMMSGNHLLQTEKDRKIRDNISAGVARLQKLQVELRKVLPLSDEQWDKIRLEILAEIKAEREAESTPETATPTETEETETATEETPTLTDLESAEVDGDTDTPLGALAALKTKLGITGEMESYLRPVEEALRNCDTVSAGMSLDDVLGTYGELMPETTREELASFRKALSE